MTATQRNSDDRQNSHRLLADKIDHVRAIAQSSLARYSRLSPEDCRESYLLHKDEFCGIRFSLGAFRAIWRTEDSNIVFQRDGTQIGAVNLNESQQAKAA